MYEFSDLQCPFCQRYFIQTEPAINENYVRNGDLRVVFRDLPLVQLHPNAPAAHIASICAADQGSAKSYWEMHEQLFRTVDEWASAADPNQNFIELATEVGLDVDAFEACLADEAKATQVEERVAEAMAFGFSGTPSFQFVREETGDTYEIVGAQPFDAFAEMIEALVAGETPAAAAQQGAGGDQEVPTWATAEGLQPDPDRPGYTMAGDQYRGNPDAAVVVVEYSDFQCPFCQRHTLDTQPILDETFVDSDQVLWVFKHFPLSIHPQAPAAGVAAECAAEQGQFWEMHHLLFTNSSSWSVSDPSTALTDLAAELGLDTEKFAACLEDEEIMARVDNDLADGAQFVRGTPTFVVLFNGQGSIIPGALPADRFVSALQEMVDEAAQ
ncbi:MAG: thioredoxin domain-containing protein [Caldilineaceae bacterium]|nr:thioredoxin domain-containing protein [Caldilineaceae bacterium]